MNYRPYLELARKTIEAHVLAKTVEPETENVESRGVFVTIWKNEKGEKQLRGCIGHLSPIKKTLGEEVQGCAIAAATQDPRFPPLDESELGSISLELSILEPLEKIKDESMLDPKKYGVVVVSGNQRGTLLPEVDGINSVEMQVSIAKQKAGILPHEAVELYRYGVTKIEE